MKLSGLLLAALSIVFAAISYISLSQNIATKHGQIVMITIATYTFYKISIAIIQAVKQHKNPSPLLRTLRSIRYAEVAASVVTLQRSMLVSFGAMEARKICWLNSITGVAVYLFVLVLGISMIIKSTRKEQE